MSKISMKSPVPGPKSQALIDIDKQYLSPSYTRDPSYSIAVKEAKGMWVTDLDDNVYLDFTAGIAVCSTGHSHPKIVETIVKQSEKLIHMAGTDYYYDSQVYLAKKLSEITPGNIRKNVFFGNSGTEANEAAIKLARYHTKRTQFISFLGSFHGRTMGSLSLNGSKVLHKKRMGPFMPGVTQIPYANCYRCPVNQDAKTCKVECLSYLEDELFTSVLPPEEVAAVFVETVQGEGGYVIPPAKFFQKLKGICEKYGILYADDEVQSGIGRTGKMWAIDHFGVVPDIITSAKGIASGMPLGAMIARHDIMTWEAGSHATTFGGNPVSCAVALTTIDLIETELMKNAEVVGNYLIESLKSLQAKHRLIGDVRGLGLMAGIELVKDRVTKERAVDERNAVIGECLKRGLLILSCGKNTIRFCPPLIASREDIDTALSIVSDALTAVESKAFKN